MIYKDQNDIMLDHGEKTYQVRLSGCGQEVAIFDGYTKITGFSVDALLEEEGLNRYSFAEPFSPTFEFLCGVEDVLVAPLNAIANNKIKAAKDVERLKASLTFPDKVAA